MQQGPNGQVAELSGAATEKEKIAVITKDMFRL
jgi:hypothetical protein